MDSKLKKVLDKMSKVINQIDGLDPFIRVMEDKAESLIELDYTVDDICEYFYKEFNRFLEENNYTLYLAYGSNMDLNQMDYRCPDSFVFDTVVVDNYKFVLDSAGVASIIPSKGSKVEAMLWVVSALDVETLDTYEGVAYGCYEKTTMPIIIDGVKIEVLVYFSLRDIINTGYRSGYMSRIIKAAIDANFSEGYIKELSTWNR